MKTLVQLSAAFIALILVAQPSAGQTEVQLSPEKDNTLYENASGTVSNGAGEYIFAGLTNRNELRRAVLAFDIAGNVPAGATIDSVKLVLVMNRAISGPLPATLHRVSRDWGEGSSDADNQEGTGTTATTGDATWIHSLFDTQNWTTPGGDFEATASAAASVGGNGAYTWGSTAGMIADVQAWLDDPANNFGWILLGDESTTASAKRYDSREGTSPPELQVFYSVSTAIDDAADVPSALINLTSYPNPFSSSTQIDYSLSEARDVRVDVYDTLGRHVVTLAEGFHSPGRYSARFDANGLPSGAYFYRVASDDFSKYGQMVLIR